MSILVSLIHTLFHILRKHNTIKTTMPYSILKTIYTQKLSHTYKTYTFYTIYTYTPALNKTNCARNYKFSHLLLLHMTISPQIETQYNTLKTNGS